VTPRLPDDAPNALIILIDDGGSCRTLRPDHPYPAGRFLELVSKPGRVSTAPDDDQQTGAERGIVVAQAR
jgi:hypothetical protein